MIEGFVEETLVHIMIHRGIATPHDYGRVQIMRSVCTNFTV